jgi:hypothetical protein
VSLADAGRIVKSSPEVAEKQVNKKLGFVVVVAKFCFVILLR